MNGLGLAGAAQVNGFLPGIDHGIEQGHEHAAFDVLFEPPVGPHHDIADTYRILIRGGVFLYPAMTTHPNGKIRLLYEANPMSFIVEQAGGMSITGRQRIMELKPGKLHQRVPVVLGSKEEVQRVMDYHREFDAENAA